MKYALILVPFHSMTTNELENYAVTHPELEFCFSDTSVLSALVKRKITSRTKIIAARANSAKLIKKWYPEIQVIEIPLTSYDILRSMEKVKIFGKTIGLVTTNDFLLDKALFEEIFQVKILNYSLTPTENFRLVIEQAINDGADVILGGALAYNVAKDLNIKCITLQMGMESMNRTLSEIKLIKETIDFESRSQQFLSLLMDNILEGIISINSDGKIKSVNSVIEKIFGLSSKLLIEQDIEKIFNYSDNCISINNLINNESKIIVINGYELIIRKLPLIDNNNNLGTIITLHETKNIHNMENVIRQKKYFRNKEARYTFEDIIGESSTIRDSISLGRDYAKTDFNVLITGETGSGKELFAQSLHNESHRKNKPFIAINCAAIPKNLLESELFGYVEGAFTGAAKKGKLGLFEIAHEGTVFLDEISEMNFESQGALLRFIQEKYMTRLGSNEMIPIDVRIIAATNKNLKKMVNENRFRNDLYYRLNVLNLTLPSIRERKSDIIIFLKYFLANESKISGNIISFSDEAKIFIEEYSWPGNVREIRNIAQRILATANSAIVTKEFLEKIIDFKITDTHSLNYEILEKNNFTTKEKNQKSEIEFALTKFKGNTAEVSVFLKISKATLWRRMKKYHIT